MSLVRLGLSEPSQNTYAMPLNRWLTHVYYFFQFVAQVTDMALPVKNVLEG